jgi:endonuclease/exonuclease/phosphatase (EEP) superfamily protein YafD
MPEAWDSTHIEFGRPSQESLNPLNFNILIWNVFKGSRKKWHDDFLKLSSDKNLILLQEACINNHMSRTFEKLSQYIFYFGLSFLLSKRKNIPTGTLLASHALALSSGAERTRDLEPFIKTPKTFTWAKYKLTATDSELLVINIHALNFTGHLAFINQINQCLDLIDRHCGPVVFAGDFNTRTKKRMSDLTSMLGELKLDLVDFGSAKKSKILGLDLDHAFIRGLDINSLQVRTDIKSSDHLPLELSLRFK